MRNLRTSATRLSSERDVITEERRQRVDNSPQAVMSERMRAMMFPHHPYGTPIIGWMHEIQALDRANAEQFYRTWYAPNNAILVVAGDIDAAELRPLAERHYGRLRPTRDLPARVWVRDPPAVGPMRVIHRDEKVRQPSMSRLYRATSYATDEARQAHALDVAMEVLGGSQTSRLYRILVEERGIAVGAGASSQTAGLGGGLVWRDAGEGVSLETRKRRWMKSSPNICVRAPPKGLARAKSRSRPRSIRAAANKSRHFSPPWRRALTISQLARRYRRGDARGAGDGARTLVIENSVTGWLMARRRGHDEGAAVYARVFLRAPAPAALAQTRRRPVIIASTSSR